MALPRLCVDIDNVIARTDEVMRDVIREYTGGLVNLDYEHIRTFDYQECTDANGRAITSKDWKIVHGLFADSNRILSIKPYPFVQARLGELGEKFSIHFATSRLPKARKATIEWFERNGFDFKYDLHFVQHGEKHTSLGRFTASIEDDLNQALEFAKAETTSFLTDHPWNRSVHQGSPDNLYRVAGRAGAEFETVWDAIRDALLSLKQGE